MWSVWGAAADSLPVSGVRGSVGSRGVGGARDVSVRICVGGVRVSYIGWFGLFCFWVGVWACEKRGLTLTKPGGFLGLGIAAAISFAIGLGSAILADAIGVK